VLLGLTVGQRGLVVSFCDPTLGESGRPGSIF
jgi:hypothetical protein